MICYVFRGYPLHVPRERSASFKLTLNQEGSFATQPERAGIGQLATLCQVEKGF